MPKVYTSRYANPELAAGDYTVVGVTRGAPKFALKYNLSGNIIQIAPPGWLFSENNRERFTPQYFWHMEKTGVTRIKDILEQYLALGKDVVLCCYEDVRKQDEWCHRLVFAEWWETKTGIRIVELGDPSGIKPTAEKKASCVKVKEKEEGYFAARMKGVKIEEPTQQISLFDTRQ